MTLSIVMLLETKMTTRFPAGVNNATNDSTLSNYSAPDPGRNAQLFDDFFALTVPGVWTQVETQAGATQSVAPGGGGLVALVNTAAIGDYCGLGSTTAVYNLDVSKKAFGKARFSISDNANVNFAMAFGEQAQSAAPTNGLVVRRTAGVYVIENKVGGVVTNTASLADPGTFATSVQNTLGLEYDGRGNASLYA